MPRQLATIIFILIIIYLFWIDRKNNEGFSKTLWVPFLWLYFTRSRGISEWLHLGTPDISGSVLEGNALNRNIYTVFIIAGIWLLSKRRINWQSWFSKNPWIWLYFIYGLISIFWSDYPFVSFKRWVKATSTIIMTLLILTESKPYLALGLIIKRLMFIFLPLSVLFIKYIPELGRAFHQGMPMYTGVCTHKNALGALCFLSFIYFTWNLTFGRKLENEKSQQLHYSIYLIIIPMTAWLLYKADSATSLACSIIGVSIFFLAKHPFFTREPRKIIPFGIVTMVILGIAQLLFNIKDTIIIMLGRRPDLTTRVPMWKDLLSMVKNPITGFGYESFWLGERLVHVQSEWGQLIQAHNGYIEMYLNMGIIGVFFILCWIISGIKKVNKNIVYDYPSGILRLCLIITVLFYNYTEATFYGPNSMWMLLFIGIMDPPELIIPKKLYLQKDAGIKSVSSPNK